MPHKQSTTPLLEHPIPDAFRPFYEDKATHLLDHLLAMVADRDALAALNDNAAYLRRRKEAISLISVGIAMNAEFF